jgi:hypothetical protein
VILQHRKHRVVGWVRCIVWVGDDVLDIELARFGDDEAKLLIRDRKIGKVLLRHGKSSSILRFGGELKRRERASDEQNELQIYLHRN